MIDVINTIYQEKKQKQKENKIIYPYNNPYIKTKGKQIDVSKTKL